MSKYLKTGVLSLALVINHSFAGGIPTIDASAIAQDAANHVAHMAEIAKQLLEAKAQLEQMKANVKALTGSKGFSELLRMGGVDPALTQTFDDLLKGNTSGLTAKAKSYFDSLPTSCADAKNKSMCEQVSLSAIAQIDYAEKLNNQLMSKMNTITHLSERAKQAKDMKSMSELQTQIALETNSLSVLKLQADNFEKLQKAQARIFAEQKREREIENRWKIINAPKKDPELIDVKKLFK